MYNSSGLFQYNHPDWLGSARLFSTPSRGANPAMAYAPFGEGYAGGQQWIQFTSAGNAWTVAYNENQTGSLEDFMFRRYSPSQSRWISPDPAGLAAVDPANPQTWNRYAYVANNPLSYVDPKGLQLAGPGGCNLIDGCGSNAPGGGGGGGGGSADCSAEFSDCSGSYMDGIQMPGSTIQTLISFGWAVPCPNGQCSGVAIGGVLSYFSAYLTGSTYAPYAGPGSIFDTNNQAMVAGAMYAENQSLLNNGTERCGVTYAVGDQYTFSAPAGGAATDCTPSQAMSSDYQQIAGAYHGHGEFDPANRMSQISDFPPGHDSDQGWSNFWVLPFSLATPGGNVLVYYPTPGCQTFFLGGPAGTATTIPICP